MKTVNIAVINEVSLQVVVDVKEQLIPIKPVCVILGVSYSAKFEKLKEHPIFASTIRINRTVGADEKTELVRLAKSEQRVAEAARRKNDVVS